MKFVTQFNPGEWWQSEDGHTWRRLYGTPARRLSSGLAILEEALTELAANGEEVITIQLQLISPNLKSNKINPPERVLRKVDEYTKRGPITSAEIAQLHKWLSSSSRIMPEDK